MAAGERIRTMAISRSIIPNSTQGLRQESFISWDGTGTPCAPCADSDVQSVVRFGCARGGLRSGMDRTFPCGEEPAATFAYPPWSLWTDFRMAWVWLSGTLSKELEKAGVMSR